MKPCCGRKKNCTARLAATSLTAVGSLGLSAGVPAAVDVKTPGVVSVRSLTSTVLVTSFPELGRSGFQYSYSPTFSCSTYSPCAPLSKSKTDMVTIA